jgi:RNA polymerase sigma factor (sigma-70 family)
MDSLPIYSEKTNEEIVTEIKQTINVVANMEMLYTRNLNYIKKILKPISNSSGEPLEDLTQEAYFSLREAVEHYEPGGGAQFLTYATYWLNRGAFEYCRKCSLLYVPSEVHAKVQKYKKTASNYERDYGVIPNNGNMCNILNINRGDLDKIRSLASGLSSLDAPLGESDGDVSFTVADTLAADMNVEDSAIDAYMDSEKREHVWKIVERTVTEKENQIVRAYYLQGMNLSTIAHEYGVTTQRVAQLKYSALGRLRRGKARRELLQRFDELGGRYYHNGLCTFKRTFESNVQRLALERISAEERYRATTDLMCQLDREDLQARKRELDAEYQRLLQEMNA